MTTETRSTEQALNEYAEAKNRHDVDAIVDAYLPDGRYESMGLGQPVVGPEALRAFYTALFDALPDYRGEFDGTIVDGDTAVVWGRFGGTVTSSFMGLDVEAGRRLEIPVTFVCTFRDGLLVSDVGYFDAATLCEQAGLPLAALRPDADPAAAFVDGFSRFWDDPRDLDLARELIAPDAALRWPGVDEPFRGQAAYVEQLVAAVELVPDLRLRVVAHAASGDLVFISWEASGTIAGRPLTWDGVDRLRLREGRTVETSVVFDQQPLVAELARAGG